MPVAHQVLQKCVVVLVAVARSYETEPVWESAFVSASMCEGKKESARTCVRASEWMCTCGENVLYTCAHIHRHLHKRTPAPPLHVTHIRPSTHIHTPTHAHTHPHTHIYTHSFSVPASRSRSSAASQSQSRDSVASSSASAWGGTTETRPDVCACACGWVCSLSRVCVRVSRESVWPVEQERRVPCTARLSAF